VALLHLPITSTAAKKFGMALRYRENFDFLSLHSLPRIESGFDSVCRARNFRFLLPDGKIGKTGAVLQVIRCGLLPTATLNMPVQAHSNP
jgi:hypothetical protein